MTDNLLYKTLEAWDCAESQEGDARTHRDRVLDDVDGCRFDESHVWHFAMILVL